jgi:benzoyl-CoA reductase/2-hydroxyglutaryl-CoA dehydratase subunit BcrC/BadD/HgdB
MPYQAMLGNKPVLWYFFGLPPEIYRAVDAAIIAPEFVCVLMSNFMGNWQERALRYIDLGEAQFTQEMCAVNKFPLGLCISADSKRPDMMVYCSPHPCDTGTLMYSQLNYRFNIPSFYLEIPYLASEKAAKYVSKEVGRMISFFEEQTHKQFDWDKLRQVVEHSNQALSYHTKINELRKSIPCPMSTRETFSVGSSMLGLAGIPEYTSWLKERHAVVEERVKKGQGGIKQEKIRCVWVANSIDFDNGIFDWLENEYGAVAVARIWHMLTPEPVETNDKDKMLEQLAMKIIEYPMGRHGRGPIQVYIDECVNMARDYKADCVIFASGRGCRYNWATAQLVKDKIYDALGIPTMLLEFVPWDPRFQSSESIKNQFTRFFELMM